MSYVVLARKWRPQSFEDLVGQEHVSTTIGNAIAQNRVAHAFLFTGVRGVGKTTSARILAKALNCAKGPTAKPCQECPQCKEITAGADVDVQEIDGASYNGVDEVRRLQETLPYRPQRDRFKIFIVDEVHMLSNAAWNAFLKTLEEPPPHVKFIFATTEVHKVPVTILSRCQRYDFKLIGAQAIAARLRWVLEQESIAAEDAAVAAIAREAAGSMRDAMSLLDQVIAWVGVESDRLTGEGVAKVLGVADRVVLHKLGEALIGGDAAACLRIVGDLSEQGYDLPHVARDILAHLRDLVIAKVADDPNKLLDLTQEEVADIKALAAHSDVDDLTRLHQGFSRSFDEVVRSGQPRAALEMALVRLARRPPLLPIDDLLRRLGELERRLGSGSPPAGPQGGPVRGGPSGGGFGGPPPTGGSAPRRPQGPPAASASAVPDPPKATTDEGVARAEVAAGSVAKPTIEQRPVTESRPSQVAVQAPPPPAAPTRFPAQALSAPFSSANFPVSLPPKTDVAVMMGPRAVPSPAAPLATMVPRAAPFPMAPLSPPVTMGPRAAPNPVAPLSPPTPLDAAASKDLQMWRDVLRTIREKRPALASVLEHAALLRMGPDRVALGYEVNSFLLGQATEASAKELLASALASQFGHKVDLSLETITTKANTISVASIEAEGRRLRLEAARRAVVEHPLVTAAIELLGAELKDVRLAEAEA